MKCWFAKICIFFSSPAVANVALMVTDGQANIDEDLLPDVSNQVHTHMGGIK